MQNKLIESVRALAEAQKNADATELSGKTARQSELPAIAMRLWQQRERVCFIATEMDAPALLAALERAERDEALLREACRCVENELNNTRDHFEAGQLSDLAAAIRTRLEPQ